MRKQYKRSMKQTGFWKRSTKLIHSQQNHQEKKRERAQINKIRNEKEVTMDITEIQKLIRDYRKQIYANKMDKIEEMDKFLERYNLPILNKDKIDKTNRLITSTEI